MDKLKGVLMKMTRKRAMMIGLDGADPLVVKRLIAQGRLPNMEKVLARGAATANMDMLGVFPTVTPPNWTTLATGNYPRTHGITCFHNQTLGRDLDITETNWDARRIESELIWEAFEAEGKRAIMLNYCQAWPNRIPGSKNIIVDGAGVIPFMRITCDFQKVVTLDSSFVQMKEIPHFVDPSSGDCVVYNDQIEEFARPQTDDSFRASAIGSNFRRSLQDENAPLLEKKAHVMWDVSVEELINGDDVDQVLSPLKDHKNWQFPVPDHAKEATLLFNKGLRRCFALITADDGVHYDTLTIYANKKNPLPLGQAKVGQWSDVIYDTYNINDTETKVFYKIRMMELAPDGTRAKFYMTHTGKAEEYGCFYPNTVGPALLESVGPMTYMANVERHTAIGDQIILEAFQQVHDWHIDATNWLFETYNDWQLFYIHLHSIDLMNHWYINEAIPDSHPDWQRHRDAIDHVYEINDQYIGAMLAHLDGDTTMFICADHAAIPRSVGYHNPGIGELTGINAKVMSDLGYTVVNEVPGKAGVYEIDWTKTRAINHRTSHIYLNLKGRDPQGIVEAEDYDQLVQQIISDLYAYRDPIHGERVVSFAMTREEMECVGMGGIHCGDIFFQLTKDFGIEHANTPNHVTNHGYSVGCLCMMVGGGIKEGLTLARPIRNVDIVPTICHLVGNRMPENVEGGVIYQALTD